MFEIILSANQSNQRFDKVLQKVLKTAPSSFIYKMLRKKNITLNGKKAEGNEKTMTGDRVQFFFSQETYDKMRGIGETESSAAVEKAPKTAVLDLPILYEDRDVCVFVKPFGVLSQKAKETDYSANEWLVDTAKKRGYVEDSPLEVFRPSVVNRLDRNTEGIMLGGFSLKGSQELSAVIKDRSVRKFYYAIVKGKTKEKEELFGYLSKDEKENVVKIRKEAFSGSVEIHTAFELVRYDKEKDLSLIEVELFTGKTHQIRAHLASIGHPLLGDPKYGDPGLNKKHQWFRQALCSHKVIFPECSLEGISGKTFQIPTPSDWPLQS